MTYLETTLITLFVSLVVGIIVRYVSGSGKVSCSDCEKRHEVLDQRLKADKEDDHEDHSRIMRMLRSLITHSDMPADKKEAILNDSGGPK